MTDEIHLMTKMEEQMHDLHQKLVTSITKEEKKELRKKLKTLEKQYNTATDSNINGKAYPVRKVPPKISKEELLKLIDSVERDPQYQAFNITSRDFKGELDESGVSVGKTRFEYVDKGW